MFRGIGRGIKAMVNVRKWMGADNLARDAGYIGSLTKSLFRYKKEINKETFEEALTRLNLTEDILKQRYVEFKRLFYIYLGVALLLIAYTIYLYFNASLIQSILMTVVSGIDLVLVFRYHLWMFQIKQRKLGCGIREWFWVGVVGQKS